MRAYILFTFLLLSQTTNYAGGQTLRFAPVFIGEGRGSNQVFFIYEQKNQYKAGEIFREHVYFHDRLRPFQGKDIYRPRQKEVPDFSPGQWALALLLLGSLAHDVFCEKEQVGAEVRCRK